MPPCSIWIKSSWTHPISWSRSGSFLGSHPVYLGLILVMSSVNMRCWELIILVLYMHSSHWAVFLWHWLVLSVMPECIWSLDFFHLIKLAPIILGIYYYSPLEKTEIKKLGLKPREEKRVQDSLSAHHLFLSQMCVWPSASTRSISGLGLCAKFQPSRTQTSRADCPENSFQNSVSARVLLDRNLFP